MRILAALALLCFSAGCIQRTMRIESDPPGAAVWVNGDDCGQTPTETTFSSYGSVEVFLQLEDHATRREVVRLRPPWYAIFPIDFFTDVLYPGTLHDRKTFGFKLDRLERPNIKALESRAKDFRDSAGRLLERERKKRGIPAPQAPDTKE